MPIDFFDKVCYQAKDITKEIYLHIMGDPLVLSNLQEYLDIADKYNLKVNITTSGFYIEPAKYDLLTHKTIKQLNVSLNSFNANVTNKSFDEYISNILNFCKFKIKSTNNIFVNLRLWNIDEHNSASDYNSKIFSKLQDFFKITHLDSTENNIRLDNKVKLCFDKYFDWPSLESGYFEPKGFCLGLSSQIGITCEGTVVPCCLDKDAVVNLGNLHIKSLNDILHSPKATNIIQCFKNNLAIEELCQKCSYKKRFT
jgi:radical SAM protein with 4Fe4S-binding SPASM domain